MDLATRSPDHLMYRIRTGQRGILSDINKRIPPRTVTLLTGGIDKHYACGLGKSLAMSGITVDMICNTDMDTYEMRNTPNLRLVTLYDKSRRDQSVTRKILMYARVYLRLIRYATTSSARIVHILWNYKVAVFDRTFLLLYYKVLGKQVVLTAHNINAAERDGFDSLLNRLSLRIQYRLLDHIFVHTERMKSQLIETFGVREKKITVIPFGMYDMVPQSTLTSAGAKQRLGLADSDRTILFFGRIAPYKGMDLLVDAFGRLALQNKGYRLIIAGEPMKESEQQWAHLQQTIEQSPIRRQVCQHTRFIGDNEIELYFKAADVLVLPYTQIFQSGVLFMAYSFGLPVIATDVGSFGRDIVAGVTGFVCKPGDPVDLSQVIEMYFSSDLFRYPDERRTNIQKLIHESHSWDVAAGKTSNVYAELMGSRQLEYST
jgi:glycosyltransferase involved in cell wall biosynthesis